MKMIDQHPFGYVKFPINEFSVWHAPADLKHEKEIINNWDDICKILKIDRSEEISMDYHPYEGWKWNSRHERLHVNLLLGNSEDIHLYNKRSENVDGYNDEGIQSRLNFEYKHTCYSAAIEIDYVRGNR